MKVNEREGAGGAREGRSACEGRASSFSWHALSKHHMQQRYSFGACQSLSNKHGASRNTTFRPLFTEPTRTMCAKQGLIPWSKLACWSLLFTAHVLWNREVALASSKIGDHLLGLELHQWSFCSRSLSV